MREAILIDHVETLRALARSRSSTLVITKLKRNEVPEHEDHLGFEVYHFGEALLIYKIFAYFIKSRYYMHLIIIYTPEKHYYYNY